MPLLSRQQIHRHAATMLLAMMVYQLGACPCGCLEHSGWAELLGMHAEDHSDHAAEHDGNNGAAVAADHHTHDCNGAAGPLYFNNTRVPSLQEASAADGDVASTAIAALSPHLSTAETHCSQCDSTFAHDAALCRPALQVYRL